MDIKTGTRIYYKSHNWTIYGTRAVAVGNRIRFSFLLRKVGATETRDYEWVDAADVRVVSIDKETVHIESKEEISHADS